MKRGLPRGSLFADLPALVVLAAALAFPVGLGAQPTAPKGIGAGQLLREGVTYQGNTRVESPATGVSFVVPPGFTAQMDSETGLFVLLHPEIRAAVWAYSVASVRDLADVMAGELEEVGLMLTPDEISESTDTRLSGTYHVFSEAGRGRLRGSALQGPQGNVFGIAALGGQGADGRLRDVVGAVSSSVTWIQPEADSWIHRVAGSLLSSGGTTSAFSLDADDFISTAGSSDVRIGLCRDRSYEYESETVQFASTADVSVSSEGRDAHRGEWSIVADILGSAWLVLEPLDREEILYEAELEDGYATLGGRRYDIGPAGC